MGLCKYSTELSITGTTEIENSFILNYLSTAPTDSVKVYIYGLYLCSRPDSNENSIAMIAKRLNMPEDDVVNYFYFWQEQGLIQVLNADPLEIIFMPTLHKSHIRKYAPKKYEDFNVAVTEILSGRNVLPSEFETYYDIVENEHMDKEALLMIIKYASGQKGNNIGMNYILTICRNFVKEGLLKAIDIENKIKELESYTDSISLAMKSLGLKRIATIEEKEQFQKWKKQMEFSDEIIQKVAKDIHKRPNASFKSIESKLIKYYELNLFTLSEIENYELEKELYYKTAKQVNKKLGLFYENLENIVDEYLAPWYKLGYNEKGLLALASYAFKNQIRTLEGLNALINKLYKVGIVSSKEIDAFAEGAKAMDDEIKSILEKLGLNREVSKFDRDTYKTWKNNWKLSDDLINYAIDISKDKLGPMNYLNKVLSKIYENQIGDVETAKKYNFATESTTKKLQNGRTYSKDDYARVMKTIDEIDI